MDDAIERLVALLGRHAKHGPEFHVAVRLGDLRTVLARLDRAERSRDGSARSPEEVLNTDHRLSA